MIGKHIQIVFLYTNKPTAAGHKIKQKYWQLKMLKCKYLSNAMQYFMFCLIFAVFRSCLRRIVDIYKNVL